MRETFGKSQVSIMPGTVSAKWCSTNWLLSKWRSVQSFRSNHSFNQNLFIYFNIFR